MEWRDRVRASQRRHVGANVEDNFGLVDAQTQDSALLQGLDGGRPLREEVAAARVAPVAEGVAKQERRRSRQRQQNEALLHSEVEVTFRKERSAL